MKGVIIDLVSFITKLIIREKMIYGYTRVSIRKQVDGYCLEVQKNEIISKSPSAIIIDEQYTGTKFVEVR